MTPDRRPRNPPSDPDTLETYLSVPGVRWASGRLSVPVDALTALAVIDGQFVDQPSPTPTEPTEPPGLRDGIWKWLTAYQREGVGFAAGRQAAIFVWAAGSGKSSGSIVTAQAWRSSRSSTGPTVIVTLAGHKRFWRSEVEHVTVERAVVVDGTSEAQVDLTQTPYIILSWEILSDHVSWLTSLKPNAVIFDESHRMKQKDGVWQVAARKLARASKHALLLTATPVPDRVRDWWAQLDVLSCGGCGSFWGFAKRYCAMREGDYGLDTTGSSNLDELKLRLKSYVHAVSKRRSHRELPPLRRIVQYIPPSELLADRMARADRPDAGASVQTQFESKLMSAARRKRRQVVDAVEAAVRCGQKQDGKVVVFTGRHADVTELGDAVRQRLKDLVEVEPGSDRQPLRVWAVHGGNSTGAEREAIVGLKVDGKYDPKSYMGSPGPAVLISTSDTLGTGTNLQDTDELILAMLPWSPGQVIQRENRVHRLGGVRRPLVRYMVAEGTVEERVAERLLQKLPAAGAFEDGETLESVAEGLRGQDDAAGLERMMVEALLGAAGASVEKPVEPKQARRKLPAVVADPSTGHGAGDGFGGSDFDLGNVGDVIEL